MKENILIHKAWKIKWGAFLYEEYARNIRCVFVKEKESNVNKMTGYSKIWEE